MVTGGMERAATAGAGRSAPPRHASEPVDIGVMVVTEVVRRRSALAPTFPRLLEQIDAMAGVAATLRAALRSGRHVVVVVDRESAAAWARTPPAEDGADAVRLVSEPERIDAASAFAADVASQVGRQDVVIVCAGPGAGGIWRETIRRSAARRAVTILVGVDGPGGFAASADLDIKVAVDGPGQFGPISATLVDLLLGVAMADAGSASGIG